MIIDSNDSIARAAKLIKKAINADIKKKTVYYLGFNGNEKNPVLKW